MFDRFQQLKVEVFFADNWEVYVELIPHELLTRTRAEMHGVEWDIFRQRIGVGVFVVKLVLF